MPETRRKYDPEFRALAVPSSTVRWVGTMARHWPAGIPDAVGLRSRMLSLPGTNGP